MLKPLLIALTLAGAAAAQDCPVKLTRILHDRDTGWNWSYLTVSFINASDKRLAATEFSTVVLDSAGDPHPLLAEFKSGKKVKPGDKVSDQRLGPMGREVIDPHTRVKLRTWCRVCSSKMALFGKAMGRMPALWTGTKKGPDD